MHRHKPAQLGNSARKAVRPTKQTQFQEKAHHPDKAFYTKISNEWPEHPSERTS
jgi:hypothetical protein